MRNVIAICILVFCSAAEMRAAKQFPARPGEDTTADELIVRLKTGAGINAVLASSAPQATAISVSRHNNSYLLKLPPGLQQALFNTLAANSLV